jgi:chaperone modulatory protein CbpM
MEELTGVLIEEMAFDEAAGLCKVEVEWLTCRVEEGYFPEVSGGRFPARSLLRARRMIEIERNFDASPELAALVADLLDELDVLRRK